MKPIPEKDWKLLRAMQEAKLNEACAKILSVVGEIIASKSNENHEAYLEVWEKVQSGNTEISVMFDDLRRSNAVLKLATWKRNGLLTESELNEFTEETQSSIKSIAG